MILVGLVLAGVAVAVGLALRAFDDNLLYFYTPSEVAAGKVLPGKKFRLGGMVSQGSLVRKPGDLVVRFEVTDMKQAMTVSYSGVLPDLFREGQGVIAYGVLQPDGTFRADEVLAKHDENYMPPEVAQALKKQQQDGGMAPGSSGGQSIP
jgi:cytochrome c-type biogenesis protein CcmE